jgi:23S rRNA (uracil1939-C5)-methyltransferase
MKPKTVEVNITSLSTKGNGLGLTEIFDSTRSVEVPFTMPGDVVQTTISRKRRDVYAGKLEALILPAPTRVLPKCVHFAACGGCRFQHISYEDQLRFKEKFVQKCFGALINSSVEFFPIESSANRWNYRNKMEYTFSTDAKGKKYLGLILDSSKGKVFNLTECHLTHHWFVDAVKCVRQWWHESPLDAYHARGNRGSLRTLTLREGQRTGDRMIILTVSGNPDYALNKNQLDSFVAFIRDALETTDVNRHLSIFLRIQQIKKGTPTTFYEMLLYGQDHINEILHIHDRREKQIKTVKFIIGPSSFFQPNSLQAEKIYSHVLNLLDFSANQIVYDLYCGTGAMAICVSDRVKEVVGIELSPEAVLDARQNIEQNGCNNVFMYAGDVQQVLQSADLPRPNVVMVDPPRNGLDAKALEQIATLRPEKILYVSCNPITQAANVAQLLQKGYRIKTIQPVDQFPQTYHIENIVVLCLE